MTNIERSQDYEDGALDALDYITDEREDLEDLTMRVAEKIGENIVACRKRERGAVDALSDLLDALDDAPALPNDPTWAAIVKARGELRRLRGGQ